MTWSVRIPVKGSNVDASASKPKIVLGIDPGSEGSLVALSLVNNSAKAWQFRPERIDGFPVANLMWITQAFKSPPLCFVEKLHGRVAQPGKWTGDNFKLGAISGGIISALRAYGWDLRLVPPQTWQRAMHDGYGLPGEGPKERSLAAYRRLFPHDPLPRSRYGNLDHNMVDAMLIAAYGVVELGEEIRPWRIIA